MLTTFQFNHDSINNFIVMNVSIPVSATILD